MEKCNVLFPGKFKPVHSGHISLMEKYINSKDYDVNLVIVISRSPKEGLTPETSKWFLDKIYAKNPNVTVVVSPDPSPISTVYNMTGEKEFGDGIYAMGTSAKGDDIKRADGYVKKFKEGEKYYTPGVETIYYPINPEPMMYSGRNDMFANAAISSTIVRQDLRNDDYEMFRTSYLPLIDAGMVNDRILKEYFEHLKSELLPLKENALSEFVNEAYLYNLNNNVLNEGGAAGHMEHPYDVDDFTFIDLKNLITDLFAGKIEDVTEKLDGQNLFASVDEHGNTIFARNSTHINQTPWLLNDIVNNPKWVGNSSVQHAFTNAAMTIDKVFKNINNAASFFNTDDRKDGIRYRLWVNLEIIDTENFNVIPYVESKVSFHGFKLASFNYSDLESFNSEKEARSLDDDPNNEQHMQVLNKAIQKTNRTAFKAQITPEVIFKKVENGEAKAAKYIDYIDKLLAKVDLPDDATISEYKVEGVCQHVENSSRLSFLSGELLDAMVRRWIFGDKSTNISKAAKTIPTEDGELINKQQYEILRDFDKNDLPLVMKKIISPLDTLFIKVGNEVIKSIQGLANAGHEQTVVNSLKKEMATIQDAVNNSDDPKKKAKLEASLKRLATVNNELNATEGIVFNYNGHTLKLTGAFAPLNQLMGLKFGKFS